MHSAINSCVLLVKANIVAYNRRCINWGLPEMNEPSAEVLATNININLLILLG